MKKLFFALIAMVTLLACGGQKAGETAAERENSQ